LSTIANVFYGATNNWRSNDGALFTKLYQCECGFLYFIGNCGRAYALGKCPQCGKDIGGTGHVLANPNTKEVTKEEFMQMYKPFEDKAARIYRSRPIRQLDPADNQIKTRRVD